MTQAEKPEPAFVFDRSTLVPLGLLLTVCASAITATVWLNSRLLQLSYSIEKVESRLADLSLQVQAMGSTTWTLADMRAWVALAQARNSTLSLPDPQPTHTPR